MLLIKTSLKIYLVLIFVRATIEVYSLSYPDRTFRCNDGEYINILDFCPGIDTDDNDVIRVLNSSPNGYFCLDGSHNSYGCDWETCGSNKFKCTNGTCLNATVRCNTIKDCLDGSDELHCGDEVEVENCSLADGKFLCHDKKRCLDFEYTCDNLCNCFDCSDESKNCSTHDDNLRSECPHYYFTTPDGPKCFCDNSNNPETNKLCKEIKPCTQSNTCNQKCLQYKNRITCSCYENYIDVMGDSGFICTSKLYYENLLAYSTSNQIKVVNMTSGDIIFIKKKVQSGVVSGARDHLYYTTYDDNDRKAIYKTSIETNYTTTVIQSNYSINSLAVDYITSNIYFTTINASSISVCSNDGTICTQIKRGNVRNVALAPQSGLMFYMKKADFQDERYIMKSAMDGSNEDYFIDGGFHFYSALAVDESTRKLYWIQAETNEIWFLSFDDGYKELRSIKYQNDLMSFTALDSELIYTKKHDNEMYRIKNIDYYNDYTLFKASHRASAGFYQHLIQEPPMQSGFLDTNFHPVIIPSATVKQPSARIKRRISPYPDSYFMRFMAASLEGMHSFSESNATKLIDNDVIFAIKYLHAYNPQLQRSSKNPCAKTSCNGLCLLRPPLSRNDSLNYVCICENSTLKDGQNNWCSFPQNGNTFTATAMHSVEVQTHNYDWSITMTVLLIVSASLVLAAVIWFGLIKRNWSVYYNTLRNYRSNRSNDQIDICDQVEI